MKARTVAIGAIAVIIVGALAFTRFNGKDAKDDKGVLPPVKADNRIMADGTLLPSQFAVLSLGTGGVVKEIPGSEGKRVAKGDVLLRITDTRQRAAVAEAKAALRKAEARVKEIQAGPRAEDTRAAEAALVAAKARYEAVKEAGDNLQVKEATAQLAKVRAELASAKAGASPTVKELAMADQAAAKAAVAQAEAALSETVLRAPFAGTIGTVYPKVGEMAGPGTPLVKMGDLTKWLVRTDNLTELSIARIAEGAKATVTFDALPGVKLPAAVTHITTAGEDRQGDITYAVTIKPSKTDARLRWGMTAQVAIEPRRDADK